MKSEGFMLFGRGLAAGAETPIRSVAAQGSRERDEVPPGLLSKSSPKHSLLMQITLLQCFLPERGQKIGGGTPALKR